MCNRCNSNAFSRNSSCGCGCNSCGCNSCNNGWSNLFNSSFQSVCHDCNGNIRVSNNGCGCNSCGCNSCGCDNGCLYALSETAQTAQTANASSCGCANNAASTASGGCGWGYFRQYGLTTANGCYPTTFGSCACARRRSRSGCGCGYGYGFDIENGDDSNG